VNLFVGSRANLTVNGASLGLRQTTRYPWDGTVKMVVEPERKTEFTLNVRLPAWCASPQLRLNGKTLSNLAPTRGYASIRRTWRHGDRIELMLPMPVERLKAHPKVDADIERVALQRGPLVYCLEAVDNHGHVRNLAIPPGAPLRAAHRPTLLGGVTVIEGAAVAVHRAVWPEELYLSSSNVPGISNATFVAIPYFANANRNPGEMEVWIAETTERAQALSSPTFASAAQPTASHCFANDTVSALNDQIEPGNSDDTKVPRFTWWDHRGTKEWVQYDFKQTTRVSAVEVYWWDERRINAHCRVPHSWRVLYRADGEWKPVTGASFPGTAMDCFNRITFDPIQTKALRLEVQLQAEWSGGILEWRVQ
jgi:uncharacterized protein